MLRTIFEILRRALGEAHPTVKRIAKNLEGQTEQKVTSIPTRTKTPKIATNDLDMERASTDQVKLALKEFEELSDLKEKGVNRLPIEQQGNAFRNATRLERRLKQDDGIMGTETAKVFDMDTGREVGEKGIKSLLRERGRTTPPGEDSIIGMAEDLKDKARMIKKDADELKKTQGSPMSNLFTDLARAQGEMARTQGSGLVRATAREIMSRDIKSGKKTADVFTDQEKKIVSGELSGDPIDIFAKYYGADALEQLDSLVPDFNKMTTSREAADFATKKFTFTPKTGRPKELYSPEEMQKILKDAEVDPETGMLTPKKPDPEDPEVFAKGGLAYMLGE